MINAQALIGTMLGTCALEKLLAQGDLGAVFLAQQANSQERVAVKVLFPPPAPPSQAPYQRAVFLERFRQEMTTAASLQHPHILPIYTYGEHQGLPYLVMPYISNGTLADALKQETQMPMPRLIKYLEQMALALDYAHERGVIHYDLTPGNVLLTNDGNVLLADFGQVKLVAEKPTSQMHLLQAGTSAGTLEYMAPEQVIGDVVDARTDLYSLGVILYQMVTGKTPFQGAAPRQIAMLIVQAPPSSPRTVRPELPAAAEQVLLQALAKRPQDRYTRAQDFMNAFRAALASSGTLAGNTTANPSFKKRSRGLFDPAWQQAEERSPLTPGSMQGGSKPAQVLPGSSQLTSSLADMPPPVGAHNKPRSSGLLSAMNKLAAPSQAEVSALTHEQRQASENGDASQAPMGQIPATPSRSRLGVKRGLLRPAEEGEISPATSPANDPASATTGALSLSSSMPPTPSNLSSSPAWPTPNVTRTLPAQASQLETAHTDAMAATQRPVPDPQSPFPALHTTGMLALSKVEQGSNGTVKLTGAMKVVQMPVAGQPGRYVTGLLPVHPAEAAGSQEGTGPTTKARKFELTKPQKILALVMLVLIVLSGSGTYWYLHSRPVMPSKYNVQAEQIAPDLQAITAARATATTVANTILTDPLSQNIHNWPVVTKGSKLYMFENGAYHITDNDPQQSAPAILPDLVLKGPFVYTLSMDEIKGDEGSINNSFGMILRFSTHSAGGKNIVTFYCFEVVNNSGGKYQFVKYDSGSKGASPWIPIWQQGFGREFHQGHGPKNTNTFKVAVDGKHFTFFANGKQVGTAQDSSLPDGEIGMLVNLKGTEVAFSNLLLTYK
ncbi:MAG TPA: protein kinase [Ktedonobacteraceae bacterium]|nr:protein kinase [Ktedonobacteraceae bacterium]